MDNEIKVGDLCVIIGGVVPELIGRECVAGEPFLKHFGVCPGCRRIHSGRSIQVKNFYNRWICTDCLLSKITPDDDTLDEPREVEA